MASQAREENIIASKIVERATRRLASRAPRKTDKAALANTTEFMHYLVKSGIQDEDELVEFALLATGKRYDPADGSFT